MKLVKLALVAAAFLLMISSVLSVLSSDDRTPVYLNVGVMALIAIAVGMLNFKGEKKR